MLSKVKYFAEYIPFYLFAKFFSLLPFKTALRVGKRLGLLIYLVDGIHRKIAVENLSMTLDMRKTEAEEAAKKVFENVGMSFAEFIKIPGLGRVFFDKEVEVVGYENYLKAKDAGKGVLMLGAHIGSWELLPATHLIRMGEVASVIYRKTKNPYVNAFIDSIRRSYGLKTIPSKNSIKEIMASLKKGEGVGILLDQNTRLREAVVVDFMGRPAATNYGLALIALKTGAPVVPMFLIRDNDGYRVFYEEPVYLQRSADSERDIKDATVKFNSVIEKYVRKYPEQWFWVHDRWREQRKRGLKKSGEEKGTVPIYGRSEA